MPEKSNISCSLCQDMEKNVAYKSRQYGPRRVFDAKDKGAGDRDSEKNLGR